jgi:predicted O-methyltransferase YrrM
VSEESEDNIDLSRVLALYREYATDIHAVRAQQAALYSAYAHGLAGGGVLARLRTPSRSVSPRVRRWANDHLPLALLAQIRRVSKSVVPGQDLDPQSDDIECEIAYLLVRWMRPRTVVEISPCGGWSTTWLLSGLRDAGGGHLYSYDLIDDATRTVPRPLSDGRWTFVRGNVRSLASSVPSPIDYLYLDAEHSREFASWYLAELFPKLAPGALVTVDDVFHPQLARSGETGESSAVLDWLAIHRITYFTAAPSARQSTYDQILSVRSELGIQGMIHRSTINPAISFRIPARKVSAI